MLPEYDFSEGVRGKHYRAYQEGFKIVVHKADGTIEEREGTLPEGTVILDPDVRGYFPDAEAVNTALRGLIIGSFPKIAYQAKRPNHTAKDLSGLSA